MIFKLLRDFLNPPEKEVIFCPQSRRYVMKHRVFVYGTLKKGHCREQVMTEGTMLNPKAYVRGKMYSVGGSFPTVVLQDENHWIEGEVHEVDDKTLSLLDGIEGIISGLFNREKVTVQMGVGEEQECYIYTAGPHLTRIVNDEGNRILNGKWEGV
jgi:gamma-glutamylcyclotransferase (GGCT)/AIG2-like uncharacterized protein YtfP